MSEELTSGGLRRYKILEVLGKGGFGTVYRAELLSSGGFTKQVALKVLNADLEGADEMVRRLRDEARMLGLLRHRSIVQVDGLVTLDGRWTVVMEYVEGVSLGLLLSAGPVPVSCALAICEEVASALHAAWEKPNKAGEPMRVLHRDIKPNNVQLTADGEVKLLDFGVARAEFSSREAETRSLIFGSINYMAPERLDFEDSHAGDVYALGIVFYELVVGEPLGKASVNPRRHEQRTDEAAAALATKVHDPRVVDLLKASLAYEPEDRPTAKDFERTCRELRREFGAPWLKDWAEHVVPPLMARAPEPGDELTGQVISEDTDAISTDGVIPDTLDEFTPSPLLGGASDPPPQPSQPPPVPSQPPPVPVEPPPPLLRPPPLPVQPPPLPLERPAAPRPSGAPPAQARPLLTETEPTGPRRPGQRPGPRPGVRPPPPPSSCLAQMLKAFFIVLIVLLVIVVIAAIVLVILMALGVVAASSFLGGALHDGLLDVMEHQDLAQAQDGPNKQAVRSMLQSARVNPDRDKISFIELSDLSAELDRALVDGVIDDWELTGLEATYDRITVD